MTYDDFMHECKRLDSIKIPKNDTELQERVALQQELWRKYSWMLPPQWQSVMSWVLDKHKTKSLPAIPEFSTAVGMMRDKGIIKTEACRSCNGIKMQYIRVRHLVTGKEFDACRPCSVCMIASDWEIKKELEVIGEARHMTPLRMAHELTPKAAYYAFHKGEASGVKWDEDVKMVLLNRAMEYEAAIEDRLSKPKPEAKNAAGLMPGILSNVKVEDEPIDWAKESA